MRNTQVVAKAISFELGVAGVAPPNAANQFGDIHFSSDPADDRRISVSYPSPLEEANANCEEPLG
ncbi:hypothetical protein ABW19_dt0203320 [Dactylella cylindrospora]|nr:hypothetical protein ABW19_dt0203320 [Dactylella cylindrospora]